MGDAYTPGLIVSSCMRVSKVRELPLRGRALVGIGDKVSADTDVLSVDLPGDLHIIRVAEQLGLDPVDLLGGLKIKVGDGVEVGDEICEVRTFFGFFRAEVRSPVRGTIEFITEANAHVGVRLLPRPLTIAAYVSGEVTAVEDGKSATIETEAAFIQGIFGIGGERQGKIVALKVANSEMVTEETLRQCQGRIENAVLVGGSGFTQGAFAVAAKEGASAVVTGSIDSATLRSFLGYEIGVSVTGDEPVPFTLIISEGFGCLPISQRVMELVAELDGQSASVNGATQVRAGALRPEVIVPLAGVAGQVAAETAGAAHELVLGARIRLIRVPHFGSFGTVTGLPSAPQLIPTGARVRVLQARLDSNEEVIVPRANVELV